MQIDNATRETSRGLGLGLAIVKRCAGMLGHRLSLRSEPGRGSCFAVELPLAQAAPALAKPLAADAAGAESLASRRVVLVEDDPAVRMALLARLEAWGAQVHAFDDLPALRTWLDQAASGPDLILSDYRLPSGTGVEAIAEVRRRFDAPGQHTPAALLTGDTAPEELTRLQAAQVPVLHKPFRAEALLALWAQARPGAP